jgi:cold shock CspA family protein
VTRGRIKPGSRPEKGYYFIRPADGDLDIFIHESVLVGVDDLEIGDMVDVEYETGWDGRLRATYCAKVNP